MVLFLVGFSCFIVGASVGACFGTMVAAGAIAAEVAGQ